LYFADGCGIKMMNDSDSREERRSKMKERMGGMKEKVKPALIILAVLVVIYCAWYSYDRFFSYAGVANAITIEVQNVEVSERYGEHTVVWATHSDGDKTIKYTLKGRHDFVPGTTYRIEYVNKVRVLWISLRLALWGEATSISQIG
jgi:hypothetical protein